MRWASHMARMGQRIATCRAWKGILRETDQFKYLGVDGRITLQQILRTSGRSAWTGFIWLIKGQVTGSFERSNKMFP